MVISLFSLNKVSVFLILFALIQSSFLLLAFDINTSSIGAAFGQEVIETTTTENTLTPDLSPVQEQQKEQQQQEQPNSDSILLTEIELLKLVDRAGDAAQESNYLKMSATGGDEECCQVIQYTPGPIGIAGVTFKGEQAFDLSGAKRVVFFAKGQQGGENLRFLAAGTTTGNSSINEQTSGPLPPFNNGSSQPSSALLSSPADIFQGKNFGRITENLILDRNWNRYQISLEGIDLNGIIDPFGFIMENTNGSGSSATFYLKGVTYDTKVATDPVATLEENSTASSIPSNSTASSIPSNSTASSIPSNSTASSIPSNSTASSIPSNSTASSIPSNSTESNPLIIPPQSRDNATTVDSNNNTTDGVTAITTNNQNPAPDQNLTQPPSDNTPINSTTSFLSSSSILPFDNTTTTRSSPLASFSAPNNTVARSFGSQIPMTDLLNSNSDENEWLSNNNGGFIDSLDRTEFVVSSDNGGNSSLDLSAINSSTPADETSLTGDSIPASTIIDSFANSNQNGRESTPDQPQPAPFNTPETFAINNNPISLQPTSLFPSSQSVITPQPSLLPPEAFNPPASDAIPADTVIPSVVESNSGLTIQNGGSIDSRSIASDITAPDTHILSVVDSNNAAVLNGSSTSIPSSSPSTSPVNYPLAPPGSAANNITFTFAATDDSNIITGYECSSYSYSSLPEQIAFVPCTSPTVMQILAESSTTPTQSGTGNDTTYLFQVRATDTAGNVDPLPATFQWTNTPVTGPTDTGVATAEQQDPLLQQQLPQDPLLQQQQQQLPQDPLLQQQQQLPQDPLLQQQQQQPGITIQGPFPGTGQFGQIPQQQSTQQGSIDQNALPSPVIVPTPTQQLPSLPSGTTIYGSSNDGSTDFFGTDQSGFDVNHNSASTDYN
jgi:hypothetical protein